MYILIKQDNFDEIGPNDFRFLEKLEGLVHWMTGERNLEKIEIGRNGDESNGGHRV